MSDIYLCKHCGSTHATYGDIALTLCGCDGTQHNACTRVLAPTGTLRPEQWPAYLTWETAPNT